MLDHAYWTTDDVAKVTRTTAATVRYWRHMGTGPEGFVCGRRVLYSRDVVEQWLQNLQTSQAAVERPA